LESLVQSLKKLHSGKLFVFSFLLLIFLPRIVQKGMFGDGLLYAAIARNLAEGKGSWWTPYFSSSYWLENIPEYYYENPPLMLWIQSLYFKVVGDFWWTEKSFGVILFVVNVLMLRWVWKTYFYNDTQKANYWFVLPLFWNFQPITPWGNVNNMMDNMLLTCCLAAIAFTLQGIHVSKVVNIKALTAAAIMVFLGLMVKGPVALYPMALPVVYWWIKRSPSLMLSVSSSAFILGGSILCFVCMLYFVPDALEYFQAYWNQRLKAVITGSRNDMKLMGWDRFYILGQLAIQILPATFIAVVSFFIAKANKIKLPHQDALIFVIMGFGATLPILASTKQSGIYLIPGLPMFSIAALMYSLPAIEILFNKHFFIKYKTQINVLWGSLLLIGVISTYTNYGKKGREQGIISDLEQIKPMIPQNSYISVCDTMMHDFVIHTYAQRMNHYELKSIADSSEYLMTNHLCDSLDIKKLYNYQRLEITGLDYFTIYKKK
jgi:hypothetical protein